MKTYRVETQLWKSPNGSWEEAQKWFELLQQLGLDEGANHDTYIQLVLVDEKNPSLQVLRKGVPLIDEGKMAQSTPKENGIQADFWVKEWREVKEC